jgi:Pro-Pro endopeptidase
MRKWVVSSVIAGLFISMITTSQASLDSIPLENYPKNSELYQFINNKTSLEHLNQMIILPKSFFDEKAAAGIINRLANLPETIQEKINKNDITLKLFTGKLTDNQTARYLAGQTPRGYHSQTTWDEVPGIGGSKVVLVKIGHSEKGKGHGSVNLELHELAHSVDKLVFQNVSKNKEFQQIWEAERGILFPGNSYFILHAEEYFAETFAMYYFNAPTKIQLQKLAPQTYDFFQKLH